jgi:hypothetical protein
MSLRDKLFGISRKGLSKGEILKLTFSKNGISGVIHNFPFYYSPDRPQERLQDDSYISELALNLTNYETGKEERLYDTAKSFQDYDLTIPVADDASLRVEFQIDRQGDPNVLVYDMLQIIEEAFASERVGFVRLRK